MSSAKTDGQVTPEAAIANMTNSWTNGNKWLTALIALGAAGAIYVLFAVILWQVWNHTMTNVITTSTLSSNIDFVDALLLLTLVVVVALGAAVLNRGFTMFVATISTMRK